MSIHSIDIRAIRRKLTLDQSSNRDFGLTAVVAHFPSSHLLWTASSDKAKLRVVHMDIINNKTPEAGINDHARARIGDRIQCAVTVPGHEPRFVLCSDSSKVFVVSKPQKVWWADQLALHGDIHGLSMKSRRERMAAASTYDGEIRLLWSHNNQGCLVRFKPAMKHSEPQEHVEMTPFIAKNRP